MSFTSCTHLFGFFFFFFFRFLVQLKLLVNRKYIFPMIDEKLPKNGKYVLQGKRKLCFFPPLSSLPPHCEVWTIATCHHHSPHDVVGSIAYQPLHHQSSNTNRHSIYPLPSHHHPHAYCRQLAIYARLSKSGSYVGSLKLGKIVDRRIGS